MKSTKGKKKKIEYGEVDLGPEYKDPANAKVKITIWLDGDVLEAVKKRSKTSHAGKYQTLINDLLRQAVLGGVADDFTARLEKLEKAVFKKTS